jgi:hypothetical protein
MIGFLLFLFFAGILIGGLVVIFSLFAPEAKQKRELHKKWMLENAVVMEATFVSIHYSSNNDDSIYQLVCEGDDLKGGKKKYYSQWLAINPKPFMAPYKTFTVHVNPRNSDDYFFTVPWQLLQFVKNK